MGPPLEIPSFRTVSIRRTNFDGFDLKGFGVAVPPKARKSSALFANVQLHALPIQQFTLAH